MGKAPQNPQNRNRASTPGQGQRAPRETTSDRERTNPESGHVETGREAREHGEHLETGKAPARKGAKTGR